jgi:hypothetical protein
MVCGGVYLKRCVLFIYWCRGEMTETKEFTAEEVAKVSQPLSKYHPHPSISLLLFSITQRVTVGSLSEMRKMVVPKFMMSQNILMTTLVGLR